MKRLRVVEYLFDITDRLGGWLILGVRQSYIKRYPLDFLYRWISKIRLLI